MNKNLNYTDTNYGQNIFAKSFKKLRDAPPIVKLLIEFDSFAIPFLLTFNKSLTILSIIPNRSLFITNAGKRIVMHKVKREFYIEWRSSVGIKSHATHFMFEFPI